jgi:hypothetical protein
VLQYSSFIYRNFRGDSPLEQRSGFALEASEMAVVLAQGSMRRGGHEQGPPGSRRNWSEGAARDEIRGAGHSSGPCSFVCIDEFGKGTEDAHATALCAALLHRMDQVRWLLHAQGLYGGYHAHDQLAEPVMSRKRCCCCACTGWGGKELQSAGQV